jgi:hypothetical protein
MRRVGSGNSIQRTGATTKAVFTFGRFQPPTLGHQVLVDAVIAKAAEVDGDAYVFVSAKENDHKKYLASKKYAEMTAAGTFVSYEGNENPLSPYTKTAILQKQHRGKPVRFINTAACECPTIFGVVDKLRSAGYTEITLLVGSDRVPQFRRMFAPKEGAEAGGSKPVEVLPAGEERNISANKAPGSGAVGGAGAQEPAAAAVAAAPIALKAMSGTKMRKAAIAGDLETLKGGVKFGAVTDADVKALANEIREKLGYPALEGGTRRRRRRSRSTRRRR